MDEKLRILMQSENLTASKLAEILEVKPAAISHILSGRNKPSLELLCTLVNRFPQINPYWLLGDATEMRNSNTAISTSDTVEDARHSSADITSRTLFDFREEHSVKSEVSESAASYSNVPISTLGHSEIDKIIIVYRDHTFEELQPKK